MPRSHDKPESFAKVGLYLSYPLPQARHLRYFFKTHVHDAVLAAGFEVFPNTRKAPLGRASKRYRVSIHTDSILIISLRVLYSPFGGSNIKMKLFNVGKVRVVCVSCCRISGEAVEVESEH